MAKGKLQAKKTGLAVGIILAVWHLIWITAVGVGYGQSALDAVMRIHFLSAPWAVTGFNFANAIILLIVTFVSGYIIGWLFAAVWNWLGTKM